MRRLIELGFSHWISHDVAGGAFIGVTVSSVLQVEFALDPASGVIGNPAVGIELGHLAPFGIDELCLQIRVFGNGALDIGHVGSSSVSLATV
jgi:hypothetical protein